MPLAPAPTSLFSRAARWAAVIGLAVFALATRADAQASILHEFLPPDPNEDLSFATTTLDGDLPAAIRTNSGVATAPDPQAPPSPERAYGGAGVDDGPDSTYQPDRDTRRPTVEDYDDPFSPSTAPFKRLRAYDEVTDDYVLKVHDQTLKAVPVGGSVGPGDDPFYGDFSVDLVADQPARIPTVGPGSRLLRMHANPEVPLEVLHDGADNWFVRAKADPSVPRSTGSGLRAASTRVHIVMEIAIARITFGKTVHADRFVDADWATLAKFAVTPPKRTQAFGEVAAAMGVSHGIRPNRAVTRMVSYFRNFTPSDQFPQGRSDIYLDLALSRKGVCRHRAFAFLVTAIGLGLPARMVLNEAHAWVEVFDSKVWHRIDLGGAAENLDFLADPSKPVYVAPKDPYPWPKEHDTGTAAADRARQDQPAPSASAPTPAPSNTVSVEVPAPSASETPPEPPRMPASEVKLEGLDKEVRRGLPFHLKGKVVSADLPCAHVRVDVTLASAGPGQSASIGALSTDDQGAFDGAVVVPRDFGLGEYDLSVTTPGDSRCGPSGK